MTHKHLPLHIGGAALLDRRADVGGDYRTFLGETYYRIAHYDQMPPFFMSIVSVADHWLFISSTGGLAAGRVNAESSLFPYYTDDKITENADNTGHRAVFIVTRGDRRYRWEPFTRTDGELYAVERHLYKNVTGDKLFFEAINRDLGLTYRYGWRTSRRFGFVKTSWLINDGEQPCAVALLDGMENLLPHGASTALQTNMSNLLNAYKRNELLPDTGLGIFTLNATLTDTAEPSESLKATSVWQCGLDHPTHLLSRRQLDAFRHGEPVTQETDVRGYRGAYLAQTTLSLAPGAEKRWHFVAEVNQDHVKLAALQNLLRDSDDAALERALEADIAVCSADLTAIVGSADGLQQSADTLSAKHHFANVLFNVMRGGIFGNNYQVTRADWFDFLRRRNRAVYARHADRLAQLPPQFNYAALKSLAVESGSADLLRLTYEYLPLTFSRRHGDPSRPWNHFSINISNPDGSQRFDYQGNWRDIFQNWEPLAWSYPEFVESMIAKFLNATTADGYNPYRVTRDGIEWEVPEPDDPWSNIGYWSDHQIVYLHRLLEASRRFHPDALVSMLNQRVFSHADVPYRIKPFAAILTDARDTIAFDRDADEAIAARVEQLGSDGKLIHTADGAIFHVTLAEKLLLLLLAKIVNLVPEGGIWMNTQRPEWNDANNALVGNGVSVVTLAQMRGYITFVADLLAGGSAGQLEVTHEVHTLFTTLADALHRFQNHLDTGFSDRDRRAVVDALGQAGSDYRENLYARGFSGRFTPLDTAAVLDFLNLTQRYVDQGLKANRRDDALYHSYNIMHLRDDSAAIDYLYEMLEGQVAILATGLLSSAESLALLRSLRRSRLYRADQHSYMLYPYRAVTPFMAKNHVPADRVAFSKLVPQLLADGNRDLMTVDENGAYHFNATYRNAGNLRATLAELAADDRYAALVAAEAEALLDLFEDTFNHSAFTGRSGTFFGFEGLGSIYWHQVAKLLLAAQETALRAIERGDDPDVVTGLIAAYYDIRSGIGFNKSPDVYGAFPTDPYSHTPYGQGAKQPGMTGQVKEEIMTRLAELGVTIDAGALAFEPQLLRQVEINPAPATFAYVDVHGAPQTLSVPAEALAFTYCQVPVIMQLGDAPRIDILFADGRREAVAGAALSADTTHHLFLRDGAVRQLTVTITRDRLLALE